MQRKHNVIVKSFKTVVSVIFILILLMFVYEESAIADRQSANIYVSSSVYTEQVYSRHKPIYNRRKSHPWRPWFPWRPWWFW